VPCTIQQQHARCVAVPVHGDEHEDEAKALTPAPEGFGYLYVTRPYAQQRSVKAKLFVNDVFLAELGPMSFARIKIGKEYIGSRSPPKKPRMSRSPWE
jgi:hypothetical protein